MNDPALILFDVDGTIFDSQSLIIGGFERAFASMNKPAPSREDILYTVGLSLDRAIAMMSPKLTGEEIDEMCKAYVHAVKDQHGSGLPFYPGMRRLIGALYGYDHLLLGVATGKNRRGLDPLLASHGLERVFFVKQTADHYPSKPDPEMITDALSRFGIAPERAVMIGDTRFDIEMGKAAAVRTIGVSWGYHAATIEAAKPDRLARTADEIITALENWNLL